MFPEGILKFDHPCDAILKNLSCCFSNLLCLRSLMPLAIFFQYNGMYIKPILPDGPTIYGAKTKNAMKPFLLFEKEDLDWIFPKMDSSIENNFRGNHCSALIRLLYATDCRA